MTWPDDYINKVICGDCLKVMKNVPDRTFQTCITSPPYWGLRDYGVDGQFGLEKTPEEYVACMVEVFREVRRTLRDDGTLWLNIGDSYAANRGYQVTDSIHIDVGNTRGMRAKEFGLKPKDLCGIPWLLAFALRNDGWYLRSDIIWSKPNPMPESVTDRPTKAHEYLFLMSKNAKYYYNAEAIKEPAIYWGLTGQDESGYKDAQKFNGKHGRSDKQRGHGYRHAGFNGHWNHRTKKEQYGGARNKRSVWTIPTQPFPEAHFATFPEALVNPCILAGSKEGDAILDPFAGSGTTGYRAKEMWRRYTMIELNPEYAKMVERRCQQGVLF